MPSRNIKILFVAVILLSVIAQYVLYCDPSIANSTTTVPRDYFADPILTVEYVMDRPWYFKNLTRMDVDIWVNYLLYPVFDKIKLPRNFWLNGCINPQNYGGRTRKCQIKVANRLFRGCMIFAGVKPIRAALYCDQSYSTVYKDVKHIARIITTYLSNEYLSHPTPGSPEYNRLKGAGNFADFPNTVYAGDVTKIRIRRPLRHQRQYYCGHHHMHCVGMLCFVDGNGICRAVHGPEIGRRNDILCWFSCDFAADIGSFISNGDNILFDGAYRYVADYFITPFPGRVAPDSIEGQWNYLQARARVLVENYFGIFKRHWAIFGLQYPFHRDRIGIFFRCCCILTNIINTHQSPMRR